VAAARAVTAPAAELIQRIPARDARARTRSEFIELVRQMDSRQRERAVRDEILGGNIPPFLRRLVPVRLSTRRNGRTIAATVFVMPDYLAIGSDDDYLRIPMNLETASDIASQFGFVLPTRPIVNAIYAQAAHRLVPEPLTAGPQMSSTDYYVRHNDMIERQARAQSAAPGDLVSGHMKDVVLTNLLARTPGRIAIYGWHRPDGSPIQPLSTVHGTCYEDYSHGIRLVSEIALVGGVTARVQDVLQDPVLSSVLSDEGPIRAVFGSGDRPAMKLVTFAPAYCSSDARSAH
jgi:hypothetical protein